jgi:NDP-sugar pyrophosphorylase family protein
VPDRRLRVSGILRHARLPDRQRCNIGQNVVISPGCTVGNGVKIQNNVSVYPGVTIEDDVPGPSMVFTNVINRGPSSSGGVPHNASGAARVVPMPSSAA